VSEKTNRKQNRKLSEFSSEFFCRRENNKNRSNSGNSIPRTLLRKKKQVRIPFLGTRIEANFQIAVPNHSTEGKTTQKKRQLKIVTLWRILPHWKYCWVFSTYH
jgi:hypothetical protein